MNRAPICWPSHLLRPDEGEDLICSIDSKNAAARSSGNPFEDPRYLDKRCAAGVKPPDVVGRVNDPDAVAASGDLRGISAIAVERATHGIVAKDIIEGLDPPNVIHSHRDLERGVLVVVRVHPGTRRTGDRGKPGDSRGAGNGEERTR
jgi:hypothetical protein